MVKVFFETNMYAELAAIFDSEEVYLACLPILENKAKEQGFDRVTEYLEDESIEELK